MSFLQKVEDRADEIKEAFQNDRIDLDQFTWEQMCSMLYVELKKLITTSGKEKQQKVLINVAAHLAVVYEVGQGGAEQDSEEE